MKFNKNAFFYIVCAMMALYCVYYAILFRQQLSQVLFYLGLALLFTTASFYFKNKKDNKS